MKRLDGTLEFGHNVTVIKPDRVNKYKNRVLRGGIHYLAELLLGQEETVIDYVAVGDDPSPNTLATEKLGNELFRKRPTTSYKDGDKPVWETFFTQDEANFRWRELGLFAGSNLDKDSGRLVARVVVDETKNDNITITLLWEFRINSI